MLNERMGILSLAERLYRVVAGHVEFEAALGGRTTEGNVETDEATKGLVQDAGKVGAEEGAVVDEGNGADLGDSGGDPVLAIRGVLAFDGERREGAADPGCVGLDGERKGRAELGIHVGLGVPGLARAYDDVVEDLMVEDAHASLSGESD